MSPPLVVAYSLLGSINKDITTEPLGVDVNGKSIFLKDIWPTQEELATALKSVTDDMFKARYSHVFDGDSDWQNVQVPKGQQFSWERSSTYVRRAEFLEKLPKKAKAIDDIKGARVLALLGDSVTTDHISPAGSISTESPAGKYLVANGVNKPDFNSYGARRGNHEVMMRGTFANVRLKNQLAPGTEGGFTKKLPEGQVTTIYDAAVGYFGERKPLIVLAGKEYGSGSSRDWAAKGVKMLGVKAVIAESFERIHRSNLVMMGVLPLQFKKGDTAASLGLTGEEVFDVLGIANEFRPGKDLTIRATKGSETREFKVTMRIDTPKEIEYYKNDGILPYVIRQILGH
jgi:aconitate hydratase